MNRNEYGEPLDRNGYAPSLDSGPYCHKCERSDLPLQRHEIFHGSSNRAKSKKYGCWSLFCYECHMKIHNGQMDEADLKTEFQEKAQEHYGWTKEDFRTIFGKSYL